MKIKLSGTVFIQHAQSPWFNTNMYFEQNRDFRREFMNLQRTDFFTKMLEHELEESKSFQYMVYGDNKINIQKNNTRPHLLQKKYRRVKHINLRY